MARPEKTENPLEREARWLKGVGPKRAEQLAALGLLTVRDVLYHLPRRYEDRRRPVPMREARVGEPAVVHGKIIGVQFRRSRTRGQGVLEVIVSDDTEIMTLTWFNARANWQASYPADSEITAYATVNVYAGKQMVAPDCEVGVPIEQSEKFTRILPIYPASEGLSQKFLRQVTAAALDGAADAIEDVFPREFSSRKGIPSVNEALRQVHFPDDLETAAAARRRLCYEELFIFQTALAVRHGRLAKQDGVAFKVGPNVDRRIRRLFLFPFTGAQDRVIAEVAGDMRSPHPMNRLLQGDVGCGKTVVAVYAMLAALAESSRGHQVALMAPTEILAEQHYLTLERLLEQAHVRTALLTSGLRPAERREELRKLSEGETDLVVGTHALIQEDVEFRNLALVVVDEQHRFGVRQRLALRRKGPPPDMLIMTATPIPRTLALAYLSDIDTSIIDEMPPGRSPVETSLCLPHRWDQAFGFAREELAAGRQVFVVYPLVEENLDLDLTSAKEGYEELRRGVFADAECCLLHGQMPRNRKQEVMEEFRAGRAQVMAATTVIEVGIDVPQATVMIVQHAERLGLAQLHQLRGRIGRGRHPGRCFLLADPRTEEAEQRLNVLVQTNDGFRIAEEDLRLRGPGQLFGTRQSGMPEFKVYDFSDPEILKEARADAFALAAGDPELAEPRHALLRARVLQEYGRRFVFADVG
jgi:ATP-dependent DNA helicase RecG